jgi:hypothetical protein
VYEVLAKHEKALLNFNLISSYDFNQTTVDNDLRQLYKKCNEFEELKKGVKALNEVLKNELIDSLKTIRVM